MNRLDLHFHLVGDWAAQQVRTVWAERSRRRVLPQVEELIETSWQQALARPGVHLFDGPMCRLESWSVAPAGLEIVLSRTSYRIFLGTNLSHPELADAYGTEVLANPVGVSPSLETADGWLMLGRRNQSVAYYPGRIHPFAGALEPRDGLGLFSAVHRELSEELNLTPSDLAEIRLAGIVEDIALRQPEMIFRVRSHRTRDEIASRLDATEHHAAYAVRATEQAVANAIHHEPRLTPVAVASLSLYGQHCFGEAWFRATWTQ